MVLTARQKRDLWLLFEGNVIVRLFYKLFSVSSKAIVFFVNPYYYVGTNLPND